MNDFIFENPAKVYFGRDILGNLVPELETFGKKVLLVYGGGSIKRSGLYDEIMKLLEEAGMKVYELSGVEPNPRHTTVNKGVELCKKEGIDVILAVGGGSAIDCAKGIAAASLTESGDVWDLVKNNVKIKEALPVVAVLTNAATGSEMNVNAVISNTDTNEKLSIGGLALIPKATFENPEWSYSLPAYQTASGAFDIMSHVLDKYYFAGEQTFDMVLDMQEAVMRAVVKWAPIALAEPDNYEARANLMWASSMALNGILDGGSLHGSPMHKMEHELSAYYDMTHGHGLAILTPRWLRYILNDQTAPAIYRLGVKVFDVEEGLDALEGAEKAIEAFEDFTFNKLGLKAHLSDVGIDDTHFKDMAEHAVIRGGTTVPTKLDKEDFLEIYKMSL